jgi:hypothetical protein
MITRTLFLVPLVACGLFAQEQPLPSNGQVAEKPWNWQSFGALAFDAVNRGSEAVEVAVAVTDAGGTTTKGKIRVRAGATYAVAFPLNTPNPLEVGMRGPAGIPGRRLATTDYQAIELARVASYSIEPGAAAVSNVRLIPGIRYDRITDRFGQFALDSWPGKLSDEAEFAKRRAEEESALRARPRLPGVDEYGGWAAGPKLESTGFFRAAKHNGKWWLVTPSGHLFLSFGLNSVNTIEGDTITEGREHMFTWLPRTGEPLAAHFRVNRDWEALGLKIKHHLGRSFNFYSANLERKYGKDWREEWKRTALQRLPAWGFNTIGNWSDSELYGRKVPYTATIDPWPAMTKDSPPPFAEVSSGNDYWKRMADPFDPRYAEALEKGIRDEAKKYRNDPWCLGYFVDNEMSWGTMKDDRARYGLVLGALSLKQDSPAKSALVRVLRQKYTDIAKLNAAWGTQLASWDMLLADPFKPAGELGSSMKEDFRALSLEFARQYFRTVIGILKKHDPNHMYLGPRFAWHTREAVEACGELCDVVSFNIYRPKVVASEWKVFDGVDKPILIGEFHMGAVDRGMFHTGLVASDNQAHRAQMYAEYVRSVVDHPLMVGCHFFKYADEPLTGRPGDGENYSIGVVTIVDTPYPEFIEAAKAVHAEAYPRRAGTQR